MLNVRLAGYHQYGKLLFHLAVAVNVFDCVFCAVSFPRDVLDEIKYWIESVSGAFTTSYLINPCVCFFPICFLGWDVELDGISSWSLPISLIQSF